MKKLELISGEALVIVAHPDDETIWMGGTMLRNPHINWTIFSLCRSNDADRAPKYRKVCARYGAKAIISDLEDEGIMTVAESVPEIKKRIHKIIGVQSFDYLFTHGANGEYGHPRHCGVHRAVTDMIAAKKLRAEQCFYFSYKADARKRVSNRASSVFYEKLKLTDHVEKRALIKNLYGFSPRSFENISCRAMETFSI